MPDNTLKIEISIKNILTIIGVLLGAYFLFYIRDIILFILIGFLIMAALHPFVVRLENMKLNRYLSIGIVYAAMLLIITVAIAAIIPPLVSQIGTLINQLPIPANIAESIRTIQLSLQDLQVIVNQLNSVPRVLSFLGSAFSGVVVFFSLLVFTFYLLVERTKLKQWVLPIVQTDHKANDIVRFVSEVENQIGGWVRAEFALMVIVGLMTFIGLSILNINYALALAILAGLLEVLPNLGPTIAAVPAIAVAYFSVSPAMGLAVAVLYILVQQLENNFIVPLIMRRVVGLSPVVTILLLLIGFRLAGFTGSILAIPIFLVLKVVSLEFQKLKKDLTHKT